MRGSASVVFCFLGLRSLGPVNDRLHAVSISAWLFV